MSGPAAPWLSPDLLPVNLPDAPEGFVWKGGVQPCSLEAMAERIDAEPPKPREDDPQVLLVALPDEPFLRPAAEVRPLRDALRRRDERRLRKARRDGALGFYPLMALCLLLAFTEARRMAFLPALYALQFGMTHLESWMDLASLRRDPDRFYDRQGLSFRFAYWMGLGPARLYWRTWGLGGAWVLLFLLELLAGMETAVARAALVKPQVWDGEAWRLLTGTMLHGNAMHILMNVSAWLTLAPMVERTAHRHLLAPLWLASALGGSLASLLLMPASTSVGASGGLMGLLGFLAVMGSKRRRLLPPDVGKGMLRSIGLMAVFGLLAWAVIDNAGHGGGLLTGALIGAWAFRDPEGNLPMADGPALRAAGWAALLACLALALFTGAKLLGRL